MTGEETADLLLILTEAYRADMTDAETLLWTKAVAALDFALAAGAAVRIIKASEFLPRIATFLDAYQAEKRERQAHTPALPPPPHPGPTDAGRAIIAEARANLRRERTEA